MQETELKRPVKYHSRFSNMTAKIYDSFSEGVGKVDIVNLCEAVASAARSVVSVKWLEFVCALGHTDQSMLSENEQQQLHILFPTKDIMVELLSLRSNYIFAALLQLSCGEGRLTEVDCTTALHPLENQKAEWCHMDCNFLNLNLVDITETQLNEMHAKSWVLLVTSAMSKSSIAEVLKETKAEVHKMLEPFLPAPEAEPLEEAGKSDDAMRSSKASSRHVTKAEESKPVSDMMKIICSGSTPMGEAKSFIEASPSSITSFQLQLKSFMYQRGMAGAGGSTVTDCGYYGLIDIKEGIKHTLHFKNAASKKLQLTFYGEITDAPSTGCLPVCKAFGREFFVHQPLKNATMNASSHYVVNAWNVSTVKGKEIANMPWTTTVIQFPFQWTPSSCKLSRTVEIDVTFYTLTLESEKRGNVKLLRQAIPDMIKTVNESIRRESSKAVIAPKWRPFLYLLQ